ncbi:hypothetical protein CASFOL_015277 [Castilleja foliolosa]|uniref:Uncharacterized protein n=1 Tax=Castilleja foliolosa TaxID=1961234 RepID=A0ABD3DGN8_9LAMI
MEKLSTFKEINALSTWDECKELVDDTPVYRSLGEESLCMESFNEYVSGLQEKTKEKERKREEEKCQKGEIARRKKRERTEKRGKRTEIGNIRGVTRARLMIWVPIEMTKRSRKCRDDMAVTVKSQERLLIANLPAANPT